jgi:hypothetical protein
MVWLAVWAVALPHAGLLGLTRFSGGLRVARRLALAAVFALAATIWAATLLEFKHDDFWVRAVGVLGILAALGTIGMPVLHRIHGLDRDAAVESTPLRLTLTCPRCQLAQTLAAGHSRCARCRLRFHIEIEEPRCPRCDYLLHQLTQPLCPECGARLEAGDVTADHGNS